VPALGSNPLDNRPGRQPVASCRNRALLVRPAPAGAQQRLPSRRASPWKTGQFHSAPETRRGGGAIFHAVDAVKKYLDMGDASGCHTCGAFMLRNGSCYRCMSCGSTSSCSL
jgi:hypothetical protein